MLDHITDNQLINELSLRIDHIKKQNNEQRSLMEELRKVNERLMYSEKIKTNFLSNIRNEINNPLTSILGLSRTLTNSELEKDKVKRISQLIHADAFDLDFQLRNIFVSAEIEAGNILVTPSRVNLAKILEGQLASFKHSIDKKQIIVNSELKLGAGFVTDAEYITYITSNLLSNAIRFCDHAGRIDLTADLIAGRFTFIIKNTGPKIDEAALEVIFDRFRQAEEGMTKSHYGHGLGLSIVKALLDNLNGEISVINEDDGVCFVIGINEFEDEQPISSSSVDGNDFLFIDESDIVL